MSGRSTPAQNGSQRRSQNLSQIRKAQMNDARPQSRNSNNVLTSLRATQIVASKPVLPAELIATILDYLPVPDLMRFALVSRRLNEMVYDDTRWTQKLRNMGLWNENEARQRFDEAVKRKADAQRAKEMDEARRTGANLPGSVNGVAGGGGRPHAGSETLFDAGVEEERHRKSIERAAVKRRATFSDGFDESTTSPGMLKAAWDPSIALNVLKTFKSIRGKARLEFGRVYGALNPLYTDLARCKGHSDALVFRSYRDPEEQAQILANLKRFAQCDSAQGWQSREQKLDSMIGVFENAVLREFEQGYAAGDVDGRMQRYAHVLVTINGGNAAIDAFISNHPVMARNIRAGNPLDCLEAVAPGHVDLGASQAFFEKLASMMVEQAGIADRVFPRDVDILTPFLTQLCEEIIADYLTALFDEAHLKGIETYVKAVSGTFEQSLRFVASLVPTKASPRDFRHAAKVSVTQCYEKHIDLYLLEEMSVFRSKSEAEVGHWEKEQMDQEASSEAFFMSNINRQAAKRDFLSSFKKVVMMPVNVLPAFPLSSPFASARPAAAANNTTAALAGVDTAYSRPRTPTLSDSATPNRISTPAPEPPSTELAAKAAIMNSRLEGIKSLFSIEVALNLTHFAKTSLERAANMVRMGGKQGEEARQQCEIIFVTMLGILGDRHIKNGFDKAVGHLGAYNPRQVREFRAKAMAGEDLEGEAIGVEPLVTFLELVNVGDLIQQMVDVFYAQELVATKLTDRDDFLDPAVKEKKRFEQMLDERVAAGLNKGIDVLMDEVEYICASTQQATDFNPGIDKAGEKNSSTNSGVVDIGPSNTAKQVITMIGGHTSMLVGSTDKNMLDIFMQEVGLRLFGVLCKHFKRQRISVDGAIKIISDINHYSAFISTLRQKPLMPYFQALRELGQIYLVQIDPPAAYFGGPKNGKRVSVFSTKLSKTAMQAKELAAIIADTQRYCGVLTTEEVFEFATRRADWLVVKGDVEGAMYGVGCSVM
ncbi:F-box protein: endocytic membrane traffic, recycling ReCYcling 1 [Recurvomyces mirabilis]|uniref:F-box protein: endocytic membrane traffic, recycling ReCYcling 1 n=1 Tax=Recurvomyces mirabilis TaxID=574656 RepID=A0AAE0WTC4_9PEZI|nr:F-box protein: endocytic membrane traffic, recycling ReCYcling 1 [Recurvomyces mirabilis]KAK5157301.1 F-box protein: endocytic membrane traffic, recycling ReCYcling 1 [Recurvomyces mirabilis]